MSKHVSSGLFARPLSSAELTFEWRQLERDMNSTLPARAAAKALGFHATRYDNCPPARHRLVAPGLPAPTAEEWLRLLASQRVLFLGDSLLRDLWVYLCAVLAPHYVFTHPKNSQHEEYMGTPPPGTPDILMTFENNVQLHFCWYNRQGCLWDKADLTVVHFGSWEDPRRMPLMPAGFPTTNVDADNSSSLHPWLANVLTQLMKRPEKTIWMEYPAPHFPWGTGEYEDILQLERSAVLNQRRAPGCGPRAAGNVSYVTSQRREVLQIFERGGVPILRTWDLTWDRFENHPSRAKYARQSTVLIEGRPFWTLDCRHQCVPSEVMSGWSRRLFGMFTTTSHQV